MFITNDFNYQDEFDYSQQSIKRLEKYDIAFDCRFELQINQKNQLYYECYFSNRTACGIYIGAGDCRSDTLNIIKISKQCKKCRCLHCISCYGNQICFFCNLRTLDALNLTHIKDIDIVLSLVK